jgi:DNA-binding CsgD family transcriptional regulator
MNNAEDRGMTIREIARQLRCNSYTVKRRIKELFPGLTRRRGIYLNAEQITAIKKRNDRQDGYLTVRELACQLRCQVKTVEKYIHELFPGFTKQGRTWWLSAEQVVSIKKRTEQKDGQLNAKQIAEQLGCSTFTILKHAGKLFPNPEKGETRWFSPEQVTAIKNSIKRPPAPKRPDGCLTIRELAEKLGSTPSTIRKYVKNLFPGLACPWLDPIKISLICKSMGREEETDPLLEKIVWILKSHKYHTQSQIANKIGITEEHLSLILGNHTVTEHKFSEDEDDEIIGCWLNAGIFIKKSGQLEIIAHKEPEIPTTKPTTRRMLLNYPQDKIPLQRGITTGGIR